MRLWVMGHEIPWSPAPEMFMATMKRMGMAGHCQVRDVEPRILPALMEQIREGVVDGCIVTRPYKSEVAHACDDLSPDAAQLGTVNNIIVEDGLVRGDSTEALGVELGLSANRLWPRAGCRAIVLGAGAVGAATVLALSRVPAADIAVVARRAEAAEALVHQLGQTAAVRAVEWSAADVEDEARHANLIVNCTPLDAADLPFSIKAIPSRCTFADMRVLPEPTDLVRLALAARHRACDGTDVYLHTQMLAFARCARVETSWETARSALLAALESGPGEVVT